jgi:hypothetical protein
MKINKLKKENLAESVIYNCLNDYKIVSNTDNFLLKKDETYTKDYLEENIKSFNFLIKCTKLKEFLEIINTKFVLQNITEEQSEELTLEDSVVEEEQSEELVSIIFVIEKAFKYQNKAIKKGNYTAKELEDIFGIEVQEYIDKGFITETKRNAS